MANKKGFIMYADLLDNIGFLTMEQRGVLLTAILCDQSGKDLPDMEGAVAVAFSFIKKGLDLNTNKYNAIVEKRREAGRQGGRPPKEEKANESKQKQIKANESKQKQIKANESNIKAKKPDNREQITDNGKQITDNGDKQREFICHKYGEYNNVLLSDEEIEKLKEEYPECYQEKLEALSAYMKSTGKSYKSHFATIRSWIRKDRKKGSGNGGTGNNSPEDKGKSFNVEDIL